ncbi:integral membrane protein [mine drainage metagenome]|uniref:Integral membrane protein n=1 Tax=mine drainage metagenome TaxID=410659 RepID=T0ZUN0_9ZZZZ
MGTSISSAIYKYIPGEFFESNARLYSFIVLLVVAIAALVIFPVPEFKGYIDPFYSPTILVLPFVGLYRLTCYAYRKDYNRHVFKHPLVCTAYGRMDDNARKYTGETSMLFKAENLHRYFLYAAIAILPFFYYDFYVSLTYAGYFIFRLGSLMLLLNAVFITLYVLSCHSFRSLIGGRKDCYSCMTGGISVNKLYRSQSRLNSHHETIAWLSLIFIIFVDLYLRGLAAGLPLDKILIH